ncbi:MAG TPA: protein kinase [Ktedonobacteraceae bacterium]
MSDREGQQLGNYRLVRLLGRGGFAEVYLGEHTYLKSSAALKLVHVELPEEEREAFLQEAQTLVRLNHPHIVRLLDFSIEAGTPFLVMEYAPHGTLRQKHPRGTRLPVDIVVTYVNQVASALQYAHDQHFIHRDVKPANMLLGSHDEVLLSDFGLAMFTPQSQVYSTHAIAQQVAGTSPYLSPEHLQGQPLPASDQYALGVVVYEWLCGIHPFRGSALEIAMQHLSKSPPSLREQVPELSPSVESVIFKALAKEPQQRYATVQDFAHALEYVARGTPSHPSSTVSPSQESEITVSSNQRSNPITPMRILIADDHPLFRNGMRTLLSSVPDMEVIGVATNGDETVTMASELQPHVILMDLQMPGISGIEATRRIVKTHPNIRILVVTMFEDDHSVFTALRAGARGYVLKDADENEILRAIRAVASSEAIFSPTIAQRLIDFFATPQSAMLPQVFPELTEREREILDLIAQGYNNNDIAHRLVLSQKTVANHVSNIFSKLQVVDRAQAIIKAREAGLGKE